MNFYRNGYVQQPVVSEGHMQFQIPIRADGFIIFFFFYLSKNTLMGVQYTCTVQPIDWKSNMCLPLGMTFSFPAFPLLQSKVHITNAFKKTSTKNLRRNIKPQVFVIIFG